MAGMSATIRDIAERTGVTHRTVSNVLSGQGKGVRADARSRAKRIREVAEELGYRPNSYARAMRKRRFGAVGLLASTSPTRSNFPTLLWQGIDEALTDRNLHLVMARLSDSTLTDPEYVPKLLRELACDGLLVNYTHAIPERMLSLIESHHLPAIWINVRRDHNCIYPDEADAGRQAAQHLIRASHRRIAYVSSISRSHFSVEARAKGCQLAGADVGLRIACHFPSGSTLVATERMEFWKSILAAPDRPTAVVCYGSLDAVTAMFAARDLDFRVPHDLSIVTFGGQPDTSAGIELTTMLLPEERIGVRAVELLERRIAQPDVPTPAIAMTGTLEPGDTVVAPPTL
jgi:LacI family transcriptional regulator